MVKIDYPPLLPLGFHDKTLAELRVACVDNFPTSRTRSDIMDGLDQIIGHLSADSIEGEVWVNGSFLTQKKDPQDSDVLLYVDGEFFGYAGNVSPAESRLVVEYGSEDWI